MAATGTSVTGSPAEAAHRPSVHQNARPPGTARECFSGMHRCWHEVLPGAVYRPRRRAMTLPRWVKVTFIRTDFCPLALAQKPKVRPSRV